VILLAARWYLRYALSYRVRSLIQERRIAVDHVTLFRWVQRFTPELIDAAGVCRHVYRVVEQHGQVIDVYVSRRRDIAQARFFITSALRAYRTPSEVITDRVPGRIRHCHVIGAFKILPNVM
jgi:transposase-like protein